MYLNNPLAAGVSTIPTPMSPVYNQEMEREKFIRSGGRIDQSWFCSNGQLAREEWSLDDKLHREDGPAEQFWQNEIVEKRWYIQGMECISENEFQERLDQWHTILSCLESGMTREMAEAWVGWS